MIKAVFFDLGGTLHTNEAVRGRDVQFCRHLLERLSDYGIWLQVQPAELAVSLHANSEAYKHASEENLVELPNAKIWNEYYLKEFRIGEEKLAPIAEELSFLYDYERIRVMRRPHLHECMDGLKEQGIRLGMISNIISRSVVPHFLMEYGLDKDMECILTSCETGIRKPSPEIFRIAETMTGLRPEEMAYVGDTISRDVRGCRNAGWKLMIQISNPSIAFRDAGLEKSGLKPDYSITDLIEIPEIIRLENLKGE